MANVGLCRAFRLKVIKTRVTEERDDKLLREITDKRNYRSNRAQHKGVVVAQAHAEKKLKQGSRQKSKEEMDMRMRNIKKEEIAGICESNKCTFLYQQREVPPKQSLTD